MSAAASLNQREAPPIALVDCRAVTLREACITLVALAALAAGVALIITSLPLTPLFFTGVILTGLGIAALAKTALAIFIRRSQFEKEFCTVNYQTLSEQPLHFVLYLSEDEVARIRAAVLSTKPALEVKRDDAFIKKMQAELKDISQKDQRAWTKADAKEVDRLYKLYDNDFARAAALKLRLDVETLKTIVACCIAYRDAKSR